MTNGEPPPAPPSAVVQPDPGSYDPATRERAARMFRALGDEARLAVLELLLKGAICVSDIAETVDEPISTVSHRLRYLRSERLVERERRGRRSYYTLADDHVRALVVNVLSHAAEPEHKH